MASTLVWMDGFDHYSAANAGRKQTLSGGGGVGMTTARYGSGQSMQFNSAVQGITKVFTSSQAWRFGVGFMITSSNNEGVIFGLQNGATNQVDLRITGSRLLRVTRNGTQLAISTNAISMNIWYYLEWYIVIADSIAANNCVVKVNGVEWINLAATSDTKNDSVNTADRFYMNSASGTTMVIDDLVVWQESVTSSPSFSGDMRVVTLYPDGTGTYSSFVGQDGNSTNNYQLVDETLVDDTDYLLCTTIGGTNDSYTFANPSATPATVAAIQLSASVKKDDIGARTGRLFVRISSADYESSDQTLTTSYAFNSYLWETNPATSSAWTSSDVNALEGGPKVQS